jgi:hypothetical protein
MEDAEVQAEALSRLPQSVFPVAVSVPATVR